MENLITWWQHYLLVALRCGSLLYFCPPWNSRLLPPRLRLYLILALALGLTPVVSPFLPPFPATWAQGVILLLREFLLGLGWGLIFRLVFAGVQMAGDLVALQMGFGVATLFDPQTQAQSTYLAEFMVLLTTTLFLTLDGHHVLLILLVKSFQEIPLAGSLQLPPALFGAMTELLRRMGTLTVQLLAPVLALMLLTHLALALVARAVPQIQIMFISFPLTIALGLFFLSLTLLVAGAVLVQQLSGLRLPLERILLAWRT